MVPSIDSLYIFYIWSFFVRRCSILKGQRVYVSGKQIMGIREFMDVYLGVEYMGDAKKITHKEMERYLIENKKPLPHRASSASVTPDKINNGTYVAVREESKNKKKGQIIIYDNPLMKSFVWLLRDLEATKDYEKLKEIRKSILKDYNLFEDEFGNVVSTEEELYEVDVKVNRQKRKSKKY